MKISVRLTIVLISFFCMTSFLHAQNNSTEVIDKYVDVLNLEEQQVAEFKEIILSFSDKLNVKAISDNDYNAELKKRDLQLYNLLTKEQYKKYNDQRSTIEPKVAYKFKK